MERKNYIQSKKYYLKGLSSQITNLKAEFKELQRNGKSGAYSKWLEIQKAKYEFRHEHIAYCIVKKIRTDIYNGNEFTPEADKRYHEIENTVREGNEADFDYIRQIVDEYPTVQEVHDETLVHPDTE